MKTIQKFALMALCATHLTYTNHPDKIFVNILSYIIPSVVLTNVILTGRVLYELNSFMETTEARCIQVRARRMQVGSTAILFTSLLLRKPIVNLIHKTFPPIGKVLSDPIQKLESQLKDHERDHKCTLETCATRQYLETYMQEMQLFIIKNKIN